MLDPKTDTLVVAFVSENSVYGIAHYNSKYDQTLLRDFAQSQQTPIKTINLATQYEAKRMLAHDSVHIVAHPFVATRAMEKSFEHHPTHAEQKMVLIQSMGANAITNISELRNDTIHVVSQSAALRAATLSQEIDGGLHIAMHESVSEFDSLIVQIACGKHKYAIAHECAAQMYKRKFPTLDIRTAVSFEQRIGWLSSKQNAQLNDSLEVWRKNFSRKRINYFQKKHLVFHPQINHSNDSISPYDAFFKEYAPEIGWNWRLLAAMAYNESRFGNTSTSHKGAMGVMQIMPRTGAIYGLDSVSALDPEQNIAASVQHIRHLQMVFRNIKDPTEQSYFVLAAYNGGASHVLDAMALAHKYGKNPHQWFGSVEYYLLRKSESDIHTDDAVTAGKFGSNEPSNYVRKILRTYERYLQ